MLADASPTRNQILDCGERLISSKGFVGVGLAEILASAGVPKGSFYHYFSSKERFGEVLLARYIERYLQQLDALLRPDGTPARARLMRYWSYWNVTQCGVGDSTEPASSPKCLIVKLSAEVADISEPMRKTLREGTDGVQKRLALCLEEARLDGSVPASLDASSTAETLYALWLGASLLSKLRRDGSAFDQATRSTELLLGPRTA